MSNLTIRCVPIQSQDAHGRIKVRICYPYPYPLVKYHILKYKSTLPNNRLEILTIFTYSKAKTWQGCNKALNGQMHLKQKWIQVEAENSCSKLHLFSLEFTSMIRTTTVGTLPFLISKLTYMKKCRQEEQKKNFLLLKAHLFTLHIHLSLFKISTYISTRICITS
jgi:hypothetical protein